MSDTSTPKPSADQAKNVVVQFPVSDEEHNRRIMVEATRLANLAPDEGKVWYRKIATEQLGIEPELLAELVQAQIKHREQQAAEKLKQDVLQEKRAERLRKSERDQQREQRGEDAAKSKAEREAEKEKKKQEEREAKEKQKEAERLAKEKRKSFNNLLKLPVDRHDGELVKLAKRLGEDDLEALRQEFKDFIGIAEGFSISDADVEPWPEPVDVASLLQRIDDKIAKHVVLQPHQRTAVTLWVAMAWVHNDIATHSPILTATSAEADTGKTTLLATVARLTPKPFMNVESTGPNVYRLVDAHKPTLIIDEADDVFTRKSDLKHIINASWTRGIKIPRQAKIGDNWVTVQFDPFCPKVIGLLGRNLPRTLKTRAIEIRMVPKRPDETVEAFG